VDVYWEQNWDLKAFAAGNMWLGGALAQQGSTFMGNGLGHYGCHLWVKSAFAGGTLHIDICDDAGAHGGILGIPGATVAEATFVDTSEGDAVWYEGDFEWAGNLDLDPDLAWFIKCWSATGEFWSAPYIGLLHGPTGYEWNSSDGGVTWPSGGVGGWPMQALFQAPVSASKTKRRVLLGVG
jgi:hypothetical protein